MTKSEAISTPDMVVLVRRSCGAGDDQTGSFASDKVVSRLNDSVAWVRNKLVRYKVYWNARRTAPVTLASTEPAFKLPDDYLMKRRFLKRVQETPEKWVEVGVAHAENVEGYPNLGDGREWWTQQEGRFVYEGQPQQFGGGTYCLDYLFLTDPLVDSEDSVCGLSPEYHRVVVLRAAMLISRDRGLFDRVKLLQEELVEWESDIEKMSLLLEDQTASVMQPLKLAFGTLAWGAERVRQVFQSRGSAHTPDFWTDARIWPEIRDAIWWFQLEAMRYGEAFFTSTRRFVPQANQYALEWDFMREKAFWYVQNNETGTKLPVEIVPLASAHVSEIANLGFTIYPTSIVTPRETWSIEGKILKANAAHTLEGTYELQYYALVPEPQAPSDKLMVPYEHMEVVLDRATEQTGARYGEPEISEEFGRKYRLTLQEKSQEALAVRAATEARRVRDAMGYSLENYGYTAGVWW